MTLNSTGSEKKSKRATSVLNHMKVKTQHALVYRALLKQFLEDCIAPCKHFREGLILGTIKQLNKPK